MEVFKHFIADSFSFIATLCIFLLGEFDVSLQCLIVVMIIDYITGISSAFYNKKLNSKVGFKGIIKKICYLCIVALGVVIDKLSGANGLVRSLVIYFFVGNDGLSIIENMAEMGIKLPQKLIDSLDQLRKKGE